MMHNFVSEMLSVLSLFENTIEGLHSRGQRDSELFACILWSSLALILTVRPSVWGLTQERDLEGTGPVPLRKVSWSCNNADLDNWKDTSTWDMLGAA